MHLHGVEGDVVLDGLIQQQAHAATVLGNHRQARVQRGLGVVQRELLTEELHLALGGVEAHHAVGQADLALSGQTADADDLALAHVQIDALDGLAGHVDPQIAHLQGDGIALVLDLALDLNHAVLAAADHQRCELLHAGLFLFAGCNQLAVAQDGDVVAGVHDLVQAVGDEDDGDALGSDVLHHLDQLLRLALGEHGGGLVEHQQLHAGLVDLAGDLDELHVAHRESADQRVLVDADAHAVQRLARVRSHGGHVQNLQLLAQHAADRPGLGDFAVELDVFGDREARNQHEFLMHHADALGHCVHGRHDFRLFAVHDDLALEAAGGVNHRHAEQDVHQRGLACAVLAEQRVDLTRTDLQRHVLQNGV